MAEPREPAPNDPRRMRPRVTSSVPLAIAAGSSGDVPPGSAARKRPAPAEDAMAVDEVEIACEAEDSIAALRGKLNEDEEEKMWMTKYSEPEIGDDGEQLDPVLVFKGQKKELKELNFKVFKPILRVLVPFGVKIK